jgi:hypothetical protein
MYPQSYRPVSDRPILVLQVNHQAQQPVVLDAAGRTVMRMLGAAGVLNKCGRISVFITQQAQEATRAPELIVARAKTPGIILKYDRIASVRYSPSSTSTYEIDASDPKIGKPYFSADKELMSREQPQRMHHMMDRVWSLLSYKGHMIAKHSAKVQGAAGILMSSTFEIYDPTFPQPELVCLFLARFALFLGVAEDANFARVSGGYR